MKLKNSKLFRWIAIPICLVLCFVGQFIPAPPGLTSDAMGVIFIFISVLFLWLTIGIDWPSLLCILSLGFIGKIGFKGVFTSSFGNTTFLFLLFTFICTYALSQTSLIKRIAIWFINLKLAKRNGYWFIALFLFSVLLVGLFISPSVLFVVMLPIVYEIFQIAGISKDDKVAKALLLGLGFTVSISSGMTTIAHVFPVLAMQAAKFSISPVQYMGIGIPVGLILFILMLLIFRFILRLDVSKLKGIDTSSLKVDLPKINKKDITTLVVFLVVIILRIVPTFFKGISPEFYETFNKWGTAMPPLLGTLALCIIRFDDEPILKVGDAFKNGVPWVSLIMCASTLALGAALTNPDVGIKTFLENNLAAPLSHVPPIILLIIFGVWAALQTNVSSNMVTAMLVASVAANVLSGMSGAIHVESIVVVIGMLASFAFATPPSMPHIAIVAGSDYCTTKDVFIYGSILMILSVIVALLVGYPLGTVII